MKEIKEKIFEDLKLGNAKRYSDFVDTHPNLKIYKYRSEKEQNIEALKNGQLWISCASEMDDKYDCAFQTTENLEKIYQYMCSKEPKFFADKYANVMKSEGKVFQRDIYVCSFGETATNQDLWKRYADDHRGFCIEYSVHSMIKNGLVPFPVVYGKIDKKFRDFANKSKSQIIFDIVLKKKESDWEQQDEWRVLYWYKTLNIPRGEKGCLVKAPTPTAIICGKNASNELRSDLEKLAHIFNIHLSEEQ